jgi:hypothetical protein
MTPIFEVIARWVTEAVSMTGIGKTQGSCVVHNPTVTHTQPSRDLHTSQNNDHQAWDTIRQIEPASVIRSLKRRPSQSASTWNRTQM